MRLWRSGNEAGRSENEAVKVQEWGCEGLKMRQWWIQELLDGMRGRTGRKMMQYRTVTAWGRWAQGSSYSVWSHETMSCTFLGVKFSQSQRIVGFRAYTFASGAAKLSSEALVYLADNLTVSSIWDTLWMSFNHALPTVDEFYIMSDYWYTSHTTNELSYRTCKEAWFVSYTVTLCEKTVAASGYDNMLH